MSLAVAQSSAPRPKKQDSQLEESTVAQAFHEPSVLEDHGHRDSGIEGSCETKLFGRGAESAADVARREGHHAVLQELLHDENRQRDKVSPSNGALRGEHMTVRV